MSSIQDDDRIAVPVPVEIKNWADPIKPPYVKNTTVRTYVIDPAALDRSQRFAQIANFEPRRLRMAVQVIDAPVAMTKEQPLTSPDASSATAAPQGLYLPTNVTSPPYEFFGPDEWWINSLATVTRVTVTKEYC